MDPLTEMGDIHWYGTPWERALFEEEEHMFGFGYVGFEVFQKHLSGDVERTIVFLSLDFRRKVKAMFGGYHSIEINWSHWHG